MPRTKKDVSENQAPIEDSDEILSMMSQYTPDVNGVASMTSMKRNIGVKFDYSGEEAPDRFDIVFEAIIVSRIPKWIEGFCSENNVLLPDAVRALNENLSRMIVYYRHAAEAFYQNDFDGFAAATPQFYPIPKCGDSDGDCLMIFGPIVDKFGRYVNTTLTDSTNHIILIEQLLSQIAMYDFVTAVGHNVDYNIDGGFPYRGTVHGSAIRPNNNEVQKAPVAFEDDEEQVNEESAEIVQLNSLGEAKRLEAGTTFTARISRAEVIGEQMDVFGFSSRKTVSMMDYIRIPLSSEFAQFMLEQSKNGKDVGFAYDNAPYIVATKTINGSNGSLSVSYVNAYVGEAN